MKRILVIISLLNFTITYGQNQVIEKLVDIGGYKMNFHIIEGEGTPILFESGAGDDGTVWKEIAEDIHEVTGTTVISYDRSGFGKSELNPNHQTDAQYGIENGILELEKGLQKLGYFKKLILVSHSYGGFYSTLFSSRHPDKVLYNIRIDANLGKEYTEEIFVKAENDNNVKELKEKNLGLYYLGINFAKTARLMWKTEYPNSVPAIDIVSPIQRHHTDDEWKLLINTHKEFVDEVSNRTGITAHGSGHYIFKDNPGLVVNAIIKAYSETLIDDKERSKVLSKSIDKTMELFIEGKKKAKQ